MPQSHNIGENLYEQMTFVRKIMNDTGTQPFHSDLEIYNALNKGQQYIARKATPLIKKVTVTTVASTQEYALRDYSFGDILDISEDGVSFKINGTTYIPLTFTSKKELSLKTPGWRSVAASTPQKYYYDKASKTIGLYPKPNSTNAGAYLDIFGYYFPPVLHAGTAPSGSTTTIVLPAGSATLPYLSVTDDYYNGIYIEIYGGTGAGQRVKITDYVGSTRTCTATFTTAPDSTSTYGMVSPIQPEAHYLMPLYALSLQWKKSGSRTTLGDYYWKQFLSGLSLFIGENEEDPDEEIVRESYR